MAHDRELLAACAAPYDAGLGRACRAINAGANLRCEDSRGLTPLALAAGSGSQGVCRALLQKGAKVNRPLLRNSGRTALHKAAGGGHLETARLLLSAGADISLRNLNGRTAFFSACQGGSVAMVRMLMAHGACASQERGCLQVACEQGHLEVAALLLDNGADIDQRDKDGRTALWAACRFCGSRAVAVATMLLDRGANIRQVGVAGSPLFVSCVMARPDLVALLLSRGAAVDINEAPDETGATLLDVVLSLDGIRRNPLDAEVTRLLVRHGARLGGGRHSDATLACFSRIIAEGSAALAGATGAPAPAAAAVAPTAPAAATAAAAAPSAEAMAAAATATQAPATAAPSTAATAAPAATAAAASAEAAAGPAEAMDKPTAATTSQAATAALAVEASAAPAAEATAAPLATSAAEATAAARAQAASPAAPAPNPVTSPAKQCAQCGVPQTAATKLSKCAGCQTARYCSAACQAQHWREGGHKRQCKLLRADLSAVGASSGTDAAAPGSAAASTSGPLP